MRISILCTLLKFWRNPDVISSLVTYFDELSYRGTIFRWNKSLPILHCSWKLPSSPCSPSWFHSVRKRMKGTLIQVSLHWAYLFQHTDVCHLNWILQGFLLEKCFLVESLELSWFSFLWNLTISCMGKKAEKYRGIKPLPVTRRRLSRAMPSFLLFLPLKRKSGFLCPHTSTASKIYFTFGCKEDISFSCSLFLSPLLVSIP